ncbi:MAG TPA: hypothetical protein VFU72_03860, partial [Nitrolancea sp.]|nr:hypothetical protein [Nitrolancea sp.]
SAFVAVLTDGTHVGAYVCDGQTTAAWFTGAQQGEAIALTNDQGLRLSATLHQAADGLQLSRGTMHEPDGTEHDFAAERVPAHGRAGLYRAVVPAPVGHGATDEPPTVGVIVLPSGAYRGAYYADETVTPVTDVRLGSSRLTAIVPGIGSVEATQVSTPATTEVPRWPGPTTPHHLRVRAG